MLPGGEGQVLLFISVPSSCLIRSSASQSSVKIRENMTSHQIFFFFYLSFFVGDRVSQYTPDWPRTCYVEQAGLTCAVIPLPLLLSSGITESFALCTAETHFCLFSQDWWKPVIRVNEEIPHHQNTSSSFTAARRDGFVEQQPGQASDGLSQQHHREWRGIGLIVSCTSE